MKGHFTILDPRGEDYWRTTDIPPIVFATMNPVTGEIEVDTITRFDDELQDLRKPWVWKRFRLVAEPELFCCPEGERLGAICPACQELAALTGDE